MTEKKLHLYTNLFFFFIFIPVLTLVVPTVKWVENRPWLFVAVIAYLIIIYQALTHANIPGLFIRHHYLRSMLYLMVALGVTALFARFAVWLSFNEHPGHPLRWTPIETTVWFLFLVILGFSFFNNMLMESARLARAREDMEAQRDKAEHYDACDHVGPQTLQVAHEQAPCVSHRCASPPSPCLCLRPV